MNKQSVRLIPPGISKRATYANHMRKLRLKANAQAFANMLKENHAATKIQGGTRGFLTRKKLKQNQLAALQREYLMRYKKLLNNRERLLKQQINALNTPNSARRKENHAATKIQGGARGFLTRKKLKQSLAKKARAARMEKRKNKLQVRNRLSTPMKLTNLITGEVKIYKTKRFYEQALKKQLLMKRRICG